VDHWEVGLMSDSTKYILVRLGLFVVIMASIYSVEK
jgi:hypothetical protein